MKTLSCNSVVARLN